MKGGNVDTTKKYHLQYSRGFNIWWMLGSLFKWLFKKTQNNPTDISKHTVTQFWLFEVYSSLDFFKGHFCNDFISEKTT